MSINRSPDYITEIFEPRLKHTGSNTCLIELPNGAYAIYVSPEETEVANALARCLLDISVSKRLNKSE